MNISEINLVQTHLNGLIKQPLTAASREADMLLLSFGTQYTLRIQCYYRLTEQGRTILARNDVYQPSEAMWSMWRAMGYEEDYIPEDFHSDEEGANRMDEALERLNGDLDGLTVRTAMLNQLGDLTVMFQCGATLTVMADTSGGEECWRLMRENEDDLVVYGDGAELVNPDLTD
ncbi:MAG: hypothetical protein PUC00_08685 [Clostridiales bacterium]|nr:hypothetical protein [Clostridiales bacterium]